MGLELVIFLFWSYQRLAQPGSSSCKREARPSARAGRHALARRSVGSMEYSPTVKLCSGLSPQCGEAKGVREGLPHGHQDVLGTT